MQTTQIGRRQGMARRQWRDQAGGTWRLRLVARQVLAPRAANAAAASPLLRRPLALLGEHGAQVFCGHIGSSPAPHGRAGAVQDRVSAASQAMRQQASRCSGQALPASRWQQ